MYEDIYKRIVDECTFRNLSPGTVKQYVYHVSCLLKWLGDKPADEITTGDIKEYKKTKRQVSKLYIPHHQR
jgi:hypothetical protein